MQSSAPRVPAVRLCDNGLFSTNISLRRMIVPVGLGANVVYYRHPPSLCTRSVLSSGAHQWQVGICNERHC